MTSETDTVVPLRDKPLKHLNRIARRPTLDIEFQDLSYSVRDNNTKGGWRQILHSVSGKFCCGELTAILGPSGAGKTSLLNILTGYVSSGFQGSIKVNNRPRDMRTFNKMASYIMQEDVIQPRLTVNEAMTYAACLKLGGHISFQDKLAVVGEVINLLGLEQCADTRSEYLSGGQRKRLTIALELVNNPPVIFLDEPTSGLDNFAIKQCIDLLKKVSSLDRTVVCTIHQPPSSLFQYFDQVYIVANGFCVYNGSPSQLVTFFSHVEVICPSNNTPADFIIELVQSHPSTVTNLSAATQNGKINMRGFANKDKSLEIFEDNEKVYREITHTAVQQSDMEFPTSFFQQFRFLLSRMIVQMKRNRAGLYIQFFHHVLSGLIIGGIFFGIGNDASQTIAIFKYCVSCNVFFVFTHVIGPILLFPLEVKLLEKEYFNRWYGLKAYYSALTIATLPLLLIFGLIFSALVYYMTDQPRESHRFIGFCIILLGMSLTSQGLGYFIGSMFSITNGSIIGPTILGPLFIVAVYGMGYRDTVEPFYKFVMKLSYLRNGIVGLSNTLFYKRDPLNCHELYCHYSRPDTLMRDMALPIMDYKYQLGYLLIFMILFRISGYFALKCRLNFEQSSKIMFYAKKLIKHKY